MTPLNIAVVGAGNIGTAMAALMGRGQAHLTVTARGSRLIEVTEHGVTLLDRGTKHHARPRAVERLSEVQDAIFFCVKAHQLPQAVADNAAGIGPNTLIIPMVNGLPFWFFADHTAPPQTVPHVDPHALLAAHVTPHRVLGAVLLMTVRMGADGVAISTNTPTLSLGTATEQTDHAALARLVETLNSCGIKTDITDAIRLKVLVKLLANITTNPLSALLDCHLSTISSDPELRALACAVADPFRAWAKALGHDLPSNDWLIDLCLDAGDFPTSMLQDARAGRRLELDAIARAPRDLGIAAGMPTPTLDAIIAALNTAPSLPLPQDHRAAARRALLESICFERT